MARFASRFGMHIVRSFREQLVGGVLAVLILAFQLRYGLIRNAEAQGAWWSIIWPYLILAGLLIWSAPVNPCKLVGLNYFFPLRRQGQ
jgi:hypothetical protein